VGVSTLLPNENLLYPSLLGKLSVFDGYPGKLDIVIPHPVVDGVATNKFTGQCPAQPGGTPFAIVDKKQR